MHMTNISDARASLSRLVEKAMMGEEIIISKSGKPVAKIVPYSLDASPRELGVGHWKGQIWIADDFDELPEEVLNLFSGEAEDDEPLA